MVVPLCECVLPACSFLSIFLARCVCALCRVVNCILRPVEAEPLPTWHNKCRTRSKLSFSIATTMASRNFGPLDLSSPEKASTWLLAFNALARSKEWEDDATAKKLTITDNFIASCGLEALEKLQYVVAPAKLQNMEFVDIEAAISGYLQPKKRLVVAERSAFFSVTQESGENVCMFITRLRKAAQYCSFNSLKTSSDPEEEMIRMALIAGLKDEQLKLRVLQRMHTVDMTIQEITEFVQQHEQVDSFVRQSTVNSESSVDVNFIRDQTNRTTSNQKKQAPRWRNCQYCGNTHKPRSCPAFGRICARCSKPNHFAKVCNSIPNANRQSTRSRPVHNLEERSHLDSSNDSNNSDNGDILTVTTGNVHLVESVRLNDRPVRMQRDSGASVSVVSTQIWKNLGKPPLTKSLHTLQAYDKHVMKSLGKFSATLTVRDRFYPIDLVVVDCDSNFGLLGRDFLEQEILLIDSKPRAVHDYLPTIKGVRARMDIIDNAPSRFFRARPVPVALEGKVREELERLEDMGVISPIHGGGIDNASPVV